jgi:acyl carrier protein
MDDHGPGLGAPGRQRLQMDGIVIAAEAGEGLLIGQAEAPFVSPGIGQEGLQFEDQATHSARAGKAPTPLRDLVVNGYLSAQTVGCDGMNRDDIRQYVQDSLVDITDNEAIVLTEDMTPDDVPGWDSVNHIKLMFAIEERFGISFEISQLTMPASAKVLIDLVQSAT